MDLSRSQQARLGAFMLGSTGVLVISVLYLAGVYIGASRDEYLVRFGSNVSGLEIGSQVLYQGLRVGRVETMRVCPQDPSKIEVRLSLQPTTVIYDGTEAVLSMSGLTGMKTVNLLVPREGMSHRPIPSGSTLPAGTSFMERLEDDAEVITRKAARVVDQLASLTDADNRKRVEKFLDNASALMSSVRVLVDDAGHPFLKQFSETLISLERLSNTSEDMLIENRESVHRTIVMLARSLAYIKNILKGVPPKDIRGTVVATRNAMDAIHKRFSDEELGHLLENLQDGLKSVVVMVGELELAVRASREDFVLTLKHVREASEDLREFSRLIAQDPSILVRGAEMAE